MKIGILTVATNPLTTNYQMFFACVNAWSKIADEIIVVDGGTTDGSYESDLINKEAKEKIKIIYNSKTHWDFNNGFSSNQINTMFNEGLKHTTSDWMFIAGADVIPYPCNKNNLISELNNHLIYSWVRLHRSFFYSKNKVLKSTSPPHALNINWLNKYYPDKEVYGLHNKTLLINDYPIIRERGYREYHPQTNEKINIWIGPTAESGGQKVLKSIRFYLAPHYFYSYKQEINQIKKFFEYFFIRQYGKYIMPNKYYIKKLPKINDYRDKSELLEYPIPNEMKEIIDRFYESGMIGGAVVDFGYEKALKYKLILKYFIFINKIKTVLARSFGLRGILDYADIQSIDCINNSVPVSTIDVWEKQNIYYKRNNHK
jgi:hypothetical protein